MNAFGSCPNGDIRRHFLRQKCGTQNWLEKKERGKGKKEKNRNVASREREFEAQVAANDLPTRASSLKPKGLG